MIALGYDDITLIPTQISTLEHRAEADPSQTLVTAVHACTLELPLMTAPMADVTNGHMADVVSKRGVYAFIHRFQTIADQIREYESTHVYPLKALVDTSLTPQPNPFVGCAIGVTGDWFERFEALHQFGCWSF